MLDTLYEMINPTFARSGYFASIQIFFRPWRGAGADSRSRSVAVETYCLEMTVAKLR